MRVLYGLGNYWLRNKPALEQQMRKVRSASNPSAVCGPAEARRQTDSEWATLIKVVPYTP